MEYEYTPLYYNEPTQVRFYDFTCDERIGGISYQDFIIDGRDGRVWSIPDLEDAYKTRGLNMEETIVELAWINIDRVIKGVDL